MAQTTSKHSSWVSKHSSWVSKLLLTFSHVIKHYLVALSGPSSFHLFNTHPACVSHVPVYMIYFSTAQESARSDGYFKSSPSLSTVSCWDKLPFQSTLKQKHRFPSPPAPLFSNPYSQIAFAKYWIHFLCLETQNILAQEKYLIAVFLITFFKKRYPNWTKFKYLRAVFSIN